MSKPSTSHQGYQSFQHDLNSLIQLSKSYSNFHKTIITALQKSQIIGTSNFSTSEHAQIVLDSKTANLIVETSKSLIETDYLNNMTLKSLNISISHLSHTLQLSCLLRQDIKFIKSSVNSLDFFLAESCRSIENFVKNLEQSVNESCKKTLTKIKTGIEKCLVSVIPKSLFSSKQSNLDEILVNLFQCGNSENVGQMVQIKKIKEHSKTIQDQLIALTKKLSNLYWEFFMNNKVLNKEEVKAPLEKKTKSAANSLDKRNDKNPVMPEEKLKKVKAVKLLDLSEVANREVEVMSDGPVTETRIKPGANKSDFGIGFEKLLVDQKKINKSYSNLKKKKTSIKSLPRNSSNSNFRTNRSSSKTKRVNL